MKIIEEGQIPEDPNAGMYLVGKTFRCPTCSTIIQIEEQDIKTQKKLRPDTFETETPCPCCNTMISFNSDITIQENVTPPTWEEVRTQLHKEITKDVKDIYFHPDSLQRQYQSAVNRGDEEEQERILRSIWEKNKS
jgi:hypothetical protein